MSVPLRSCEVYDRGQWWPGQLLDYRLVDGRWRAVVRWRTSPGEQYQQARWQEDVRPAGSEGASHVVTT